MLHSILVSSTNSFNHNLCWYFHSCCCPAQNDFCLPLDFVTTKNLSL